MKKRHLPVLALGVVFGLVSFAQAQPRPYIGLVYPAGGQTGTTVSIRLGGQNINDVDGVLVSGTGVSAKIVEFLKRLDNQETQLLREQVAELKKIPADKQDEAAKNLIARIDKRFAEYVNTPACNSISNLVLVDVTIASDAKPGPREIRLSTSKGVSNPMVFCVGQVPEIARKPMLSATIQVLGKEESALRKRPDDEIEQRFAAPCVLNGQIASGEVNRYRFEARKGQRLVISTEARTLIPYIADAVPGWFQPVLMLRDAAGREVAYNDDYRFKPDPVILCEVPHDGEYVLDVTDAIFRGREDFVHRVTVGELPFVTSVFPLGCRAGETPALETKGWNLNGAKLAPPSKDAAPGVHVLTAADKNGMVSNPVPFAVDTLPECLEKEPNNDPPHAQKVELPIIVNGRIERPDDWDVFQFTGRAGEKVVAEVYARRLDSPLDSVLRVSDAAGRVLALNDDFEDAGSGVNTHHADSYVMFELPADGTYFVHLGDVARQGGEEYAYRLRISAPQPDFALRVVPSSLAIRGKGTGVLTVHALRKDGYDGPIALSLKDPPEEFSAAPATVPANQAIGRLTVKTTLAETKQPVSLTVVGRIKVGEQEIVREAAGAEDRMQAFLWRHLVPADDVKVLVYDPAFEPPPKRTRSQAAIEAAAKAQAEADAKAKAEAEAKPDAPPPKPKFFKGQVVGRLRQIKWLFEEGLLMDDFSERKIAECEAFRDTPAPTAPKPQTPPPKDQPPPPKTQTPPPKPTN
jgi:hypothetical protein